MSLQIIKKSDPIVKNNLRVLIYGYPGLGKTSISLTANNAMILDFDQGVDRAVVRAEATVRMKAWEDVRELIENDMASGFDTLVVDTIGVALDDYCADYVMRVDPKSNMKRAGGISLSGYGAMKDEYKNLINYLERKGINLINICHLSEQSGDDGGKDLRPKITGGTYDTLLARTDQAGYMLTHNGKRYICFQPDSMFAGTHSAVGKDAGQLGNVEVPNFADEGFEGFMQREIIDKALKTINERTNEQTEAQEDAVEWKDTINAISTIDELNNAVATAKADLEGASDVLKQIVRHLVSIKAKKLNAYMDKKTGEFKEFKKPAN